MFKIQGLNGYKKLRCKCLNYNNLIVNNRLWKIVKERERKEKTKGKKDKKNRQRVWIWLFTCMKDSHLNRLFFFSSFSCALVWLWFPLHSGKEQLVLLVLPRHGGVRLFVFLFVFSYLVLQTFALLCESFWFGFAWGLSGFILAVGEDFSGMTFVYCGPHQYVWWSTLP